MDADPVTDAVTDADPVTDTATDQAPSFNLERLLSQAPSAEL